MSNERLDLLTDPNSGALGDGTIAESPLKFQFLSFFLLTSFSFVSFMSVRV